ncbi:MAG: response regulator [Saprospiraceae bacterium]|nr:response regulator [Saprospiraceae bacterium]
MVFEQPIRILIADDVALNLLVAIESVKQHFENAEVTEAANGRQVIDLFGNQHFDIILMDIQMPEMTGLEAARHIRQDNQQVPIIALTGSDTTAEMEEALASGMNLCLSKPIRPYELALAIAQLLKLQHAAMPGENKRPEPAKKQDENGFNLTFLRDFCDGDEVQMRYFLHKFITHYPLEVEKLTSALQRGDQNGMRLAAHSFWPQLVFVGLKKAADLADAIEKEIQGEFRENVLSDLLTALKNDVEMGLVTLKKDWL